MSALAAGAGLLVLGGCTAPDTTLPTPSTSPATAVSVTLFHCGLDPITYRGEVWEVADPPFDATNAPDSWRGQGTLTEVTPTRLLYRDDSGIEVTYQPDAEVPPRGCA